MTKTTRTRPVLTVEKINRAQPNPSGKSPRLLCDSNGLYLQVNPAGVKSWIFRYTINGKTRSMGLGPIRALGLDSARKKARGLRAKVDQGIDPLKEKRETLPTSPAEDVQTFRSCASAYLDARRKSFRNAKHFAQWRASLTQYAYPLIGDLPVSEITVKEVVRILEPIWQEIPETASRLRGRIEKVLAWATVRELRQGDNPARWTGFLSEIFDKRSAVRKVKHHTALHYEQMPAFVGTLRDTPGLAARLFEFLILTATRTAEARGALWDEFDEDLRFWTIPAERMKAGKEHRVPLSTTATALLMQLRTQNARLSVPSKFVFPGSKRNSCLSSGALTALLKRMDRKDLTPHGCRSSFRDWVAEATLFQREVAEACLAHALQSQTEAAYQRGDYLEKRTEVMQAWANFMQRPEHPSESPRFESPSVSQSAHPREISIT